VFLPRFATIVRDGSRVPASYLKAGDTVRVEGRLRDRRIAASSAELTRPRVTTTRASEVP
jgi:single-stranded DNA-binding protein